MSITIPRRSFLTGLAALVAAPSVVKAEALMPARSIHRLMVAPSVTWIETVRVTIGGSRRDFAVVAGHGRHAVASGIEVHVDHKGPCIVFTADRFLGLPPPDLRAVYVRESLRGDITAGDITRIRTWRGEA